MTIVLKGEWKLTAPLPSPQEVKMEIKKAQPSPCVIYFESTSLKSWNTGLINFLIRLKKISESGGYKMDPEGLPQGVKRLWVLSETPSELKARMRSRSEESQVLKIGKKILGYFKEGHRLIEFLGEAILSVIRLIRGNGIFNKKEFFVFLNECGPQALPIIVIISLLVGMILAFLGALQLKLFGAEIYIADIVGIGMVREMGAMMAGIIMAGRTGASYASSIGTMQVNEEIDALITSGIHPIDFLILPRLLALALMMPLLCLYSDFIGIAGGGIVATVMFGLKPVQYMRESITSIGLKDIVAGLVKSAIFGLLVGIAGCMKGHYCGRTASDVGNAATAAVVSGIVAIIVFDSFMTILYHLMGI